MTSPPSSSTSDDSTRRNVSPADDDRDDATRSDEDEECLSRPAARWRRSRPRPNGVSERRVPHLYQSSSSRKDPLASRAATHLPSHRRGASSSSSTPNSRTRPLTTPWHDLRGGESASCVPLRVRVRVRFPSAFARVPLVAPLVAPSRSHPARVHRRRARLLERLGEPLGAALRRAFSRSVSSQSTAAAARPSPARGTLRQRLRARLRLARRTQRLHRVEPRRNSSAAAGQLPQLGGARSDRSARRRGSSAARPSRANARAYRPLPYIGCVGSYRAGRIRRGGRTLGERTTLRRQSRGFGGDSVASAARVVRASRLRGARRWLRRRGAAANRREGVRACARRATVEGVAPAREARRCASREAEGGTSSRNARSASRGRWGGDGGRSVRFGGATLAFEMRLRVCARVEVERAGGGTRRGRDDARGVGGRGADPTRRRPGRNGRGAAGMVSASMTRGVGRGEASRRRPRRVARARRRLARCPRRARRSSPRG